MKIYITGINGYIGSHLASFLLKNQPSWKISGCDLVGAATISEEVNCVIDVLDMCSKSPKDLERSLKQFRPDVVVHLAAFIDVGESENNPMKYHSNNIVSTLNLLEVMRLVGCERIIFASTAAVYGTVSQTITETHPLHPESVYGRTKEICEKMIGDLCKNWVIFRFFNVAGGKISSTSHHLLPRLYRATHFEVFGDQYQTRDGTCIRDYIDVDDLCDAIQKGISFLQVPHDTNNIHNIQEIFNLGTGKGTSVKEMIAAVEQEVGQPLKITVVEPRKGDPPHLVASNEKALQVLGWKPQKNITDLIHAFWKINSNLKA